MVKKSIMKKSIATIIALAFTFTAMSQFYSDLSIGMSSYNLHAAASADIGWHFRTGKPYAGEVSYTGVLLAATGSVGHAPAVGGIAGFQFYKIGFYGGYAYSFWNDDKKADNKPNAPILGILWKDDESRFIAHLRYYHNQSINVTMGYRIGSHHK